MMAGNGDGAAGLACTGAGNIQRAAHVHCPALHVTEQPDRAVVVFDSPRLDHAGVVHRALQQVSRCHCRQQHLAAVGVDQPAVLDQRIYRALAHRDTQQAVTGYVEGDGVAGGERHRAEPRDDDAVVADAGAEQRD